MFGIYNKVQEALSRGESTESPCRHEYHASEDSPYWYLYERKVVEENPYWSVHSATYTKLYPEMKMFICKTCGSIRIYQSAVEAGGPDGLVRKQDVEDGVVEKPEAVATGVWKRDVDWNGDKELVMTDRTIVEAETDFDEQVDQSIERERTDRVIET